MTASRHRSCHHTQQDKTNNPVHNLLLLSPIATVVVVALFRVAFAPSTTLFFQTLVFPPPMLPTSWATVVAVPIDVLNRRLVSERTVGLSTSGDCQATKNHKSQNNISHLHSLTPIQ